MKPRVAIVLGASGQDGSYLVDQLLRESHFVVAVGRRLPDAQSSDRLIPVALDITDRKALESLLRQFQPEEIYNLAARSSGAGMFDDPIAIAEINGLAVAKLLEAIRVVDPRIRLCQASSSEMFGSARCSPQSEETPFCPRSPYGAAKVYAHSMLRIYRERYGLFACSAILFNHESPLRRVEFVTRKVALAAASIKRGHSSELVLGNLSARRDWGFAGDYTKAMQLMLQHSHADDYVIATGVTHSVRDLCDVAFGHLGLDYREYVREAPELARASEQVQLVGDPAKAREKLGWVPQVGFREMVIEMVDADLRQIEATSTMKVKASSK
jgi:GDPmannose 4,6-dehydratase